MKTNRGENFHESVMWKLWKSFSWSYIRIASQKQSDLNELWKCMDSFRILRHSSWSVPKEKKWFEMKQMGFRDEWSSQKHEVLIEKTLVRVDIRIQFCNSILISPNWTWEFFSIQLPEFIMERLYMWYVMIID